MQFLPRQTRIRVVMGVVALAAIGTAAALLIPGEADTPQAEVVGQSAMRVTLDPESGSFVRDRAATQSLQLDAEMAEMLSRSDKGLEEIHHADGSVTVRLNGRFMNASVARIDDDGNLHTECVHTAEHAHRVMNGDTNAGATALEVK